MLRTICKAGLAIILFSLSSAAMAQTRAERVAMKLNEKEAEVYRRQADAMRAIVWNWKIPAFENRTIPEKYSRASKVILARHEEILGDFNRSEATDRGFTFERGLSLLVIRRESVRINDKSALENYSEISFRQSEVADYRGGYNITAYVGVKVYKSDGSVREIKTDDIILTKNERSSKEGKVAVPDLQVGDVIDYFLATHTLLKVDFGVSVYAGLTDPTYLFNFYDEAPMLHYSIHSELGKKFAVEYRSYNGAPDFKLGTAGDLTTLDASHDNIPAVGEGNLWISPYRQLPMIRMNVLIGSAGMSRRTHPRKIGEVYPNQDADQFVEDRISEIAELKKFQNATKSIPRAKMLPDAALDYYRKLDKNKGNIPADSFAAEIFYLWRYCAMHNELSDYFTKDLVEPQITMLTAPFNKLKFNFEMSSFFKMAYLSNRLVLPASKYGPAMKGLLSEDDMGMMMVLNDPALFFGADSYFSMPFNIPYYYEDGSDAETVDTKDVEYTNFRKYDRGVISIPGSAAGKNVHRELLVIKPDLAQAGLDISRRTTMSGHYKLDTQKELILFEDYLNEEDKFYGEEKTYLESFKATKARQKYVDELKAAFAEARKKQKESFLAETKEWLDLDIEQMKDQKIESMGIRNNNPDLIYSSSFRVPGIVKKAGNNYLVEVGRLQGAPLKIVDGQRSRFLDVYAPFARTLDYEFVLQIPEGYTAEGVAALNKKVENECGSFTCEASVDGSNVRIRVTKVYKNAFEKAASWPKMLAYIDAANDWSNSKILLRKK
jgi:hypothetical protein